MSEKYIRDHFADIKKYASVIENRGDYDDDCTMESVLRNNAEVLAGCRRFGNEYVWIDGEYDLDVN